MSEKIMGVLNITPDSFSDGNEIQDTKAFSDRFEQILAWADIVDVGAESTAPMNQSVSVEEEWQRYEKLFIPYLKNSDDPQKTISIDTYKVETFKRLALLIKKYWPNSSLIFNDVSGKIDDELRELLDSFSVDFTYVFSHNLAPKRSLTQSHMQYCEDVPNNVFFQNCLEYFVQGVEQLEKYQRKVILDPCFGFSKTREQNHFLLRNFSEFFGGLACENEILYGISRKSFLRFPKDLKVRTLREKEILGHMQTLLLFDLFRSWPKQNFIIRMHDDRSIQAIKNVKKIFKF